MLCHHVPICFYLLIVFCWFRCYWGYCFESLATEDPRRADGEEIHHVDANAEYCSVIKTKLGAHRILMGAEMDCCDSTDEGRRFYVELKTSREVDIHIHFVPFGMHLCLFKILILSLQISSKMSLFFCSWIIILRKDMRERNCSSSGYIFSLRWLWNCINFLFIW